MPKSLFMTLMLAVGLAATVGAHAQDLEFRAPASISEPATTAAIRSLAQRTIPVYQDPDREKFLTNLFALQMAAGEYPTAYATRQSLRELRRNGKPAPPVDQSMIYDMYARARAAEAKDRVPFDQAYAQAFREVVPRLNDREAYAMVGTLKIPPAAFQQALQRDFDQLKDKDRISIPQAVSLAWAYLIWDAYRSFGPVVGALAAEDDRARYVMDSDVLITAPDGASISAAVVRPKNPSGPLPALLEFTIYANPRNYAKECAAHGYAGIIAYTHTDPKDTQSTAKATAPYEHDGEHARAVIDWITQQSWSNGSVGMYGSGYSSFTQWAAAKKPPAALKALAPSSAAAPFTGHWQKFMPYRKDFAHINIPVFATTGYYDDGAAGTIYYFTQHYHYNPHAQQILLIGPYDDQAMQRGPLAVLKGYRIDPVALIDLRELRYQWFDSIFKQGPRPSLLSAPVNYQVMGANQWRHGVSVDGVPNRSLRLYLDGTGTEAAHHLAETKPAKERFVQQKINLIDRGDIDWSAASDLITKTLEAHDGVIYVSNPFRQAVDLGGLFSGELVLRTNRQDLALTVTLYEWMPNGEYFRLFDPPYDFRASLAQGPGQRRLFTPGEREHLKFRSARMTSRRFQAGSRLVMVLGLDEPASEEPHTAEGKPVKKDETTIRWYGSSFIELPLSH